jgi:hypothetical protein
MAAKPQFCQCAAMFPLGMREPAILLESLFLIRIGNIDPGKHFLA